MQSFTKMKKCLGEHCSCFFPPDYPIGWCKTFGVHFQYCCTEIKTLKEVYLGYKRKQRFESNLAKKKLFFVKVKTYPALKRQKLGIKSRSTLLPINKIQSKRHVVTTIFKNPIFDFYIIYFKFVRWQ